MVNFNKNSFRIHNPPPPGLDRNSSPANASSDEGMHPPESNHHQMEKFENSTGGLQPMMRSSYPPGMFSCAIFVSCNSSRFSDY